LLATATGPILGQPTTLFKPGSVFLREMGSGAEPLETDYRAGISSVALSPDGALLAVATESGGGGDGVYLVATATGRRLRSVSATRVRAISFSPDGISLLTGDSEGVVQNWDLKRYAQVLKVRHDQGPVYAVAFDRRGLRIATVAGDNTARVWDAKSGEEVARSTHEYPPVAVAFSPNGNLVASGGYDFVVRIWDAESGKIRVELKHDAVVTALAFSPDSTRLASAGMDAKVKLWDILSAQTISVLEHDDAISEVTFGPAGTQLLTGSADGTARVWELWQKEELRDRICSRLTSNFIREKWRRERGDEPCGSTLPPHRPHSSREDLSIQKPIP